MADKAMLLLGEPMGGEGESEGEGEGGPASKSSGEMRSGDSPRRKEARLDALKEFFEMGKSGDYEGADAAWSDYQALCCEE